MGLLCKKNYERNWSGGVSKLDHLCVIVGDTTLSTIKLFILTFSITIN